MQRKLLNVFIYYSDRIGNIFDLWQICTKLFFNWNKFFQQPIFFFFLSFGFSSSSKKNWYQSDPTVTKIDKKSKSLDDLVNICKTVPKNSIKSGEILPRSKNPRKYSDQWKIPQRCKPYLKTLILRLNPQSWQHRRMLLLILRGRLNIPKQPCRTPREGTNENLSLENFQLRQRGKSSEMCELPECVLVAYGPTR